MPETSQDAFEALFPGQQSVSVDELRKRSNPLVGAESNFWPQNSLGIGQRGARESRVSVGEADSCYTAPEPHITGYKRESSHR